MSIVAEWVLLATCVVYLLCRMWNLTYLAQRESYQLTGFRRHHLVLTVRAPDVYLLCTAVLSCIASWIHLDWLQWLCAVFIASLALYEDRSRRKKTYKKPLVWTARAKRLATVYVLAGLIGLLLLQWCFPPAMSLVAAFVSLVMFAAMVLTKPIEWSIQNGFKRQAQQRLNELRQKNGLIVVGVTGSYGKTSMKFILGTILGEKYKTYVTPDSFNTPMGLCRVVNERRLTDEHQIFIAEMGARYRKDIRELVNLVHPDHGIITAVGPAHLDTMRSLSNIANTKFDLARGVPSDGYVVVNGNNAICRETANSLGRPVFLYGTEGVDVSVGELSAFAKDIHIAETETEFTLVLPGDGEVECRTRLLGKHNILNITGAALMARKLGLSLEEIRRGIQKVQPVEHRLQLINPGTGVLVIDDAFNSNPEGAAMALEVLAGFEGRRKWIITPGMVEMGERQAEINRKFGAQMAQVCDFVVLVSQLNASAMKQGLMDAGFSEDRVFVVGSLDEGVKLFQAHVRPGDIVLFENDLPDHLEQTS